MSKERNGQLNLLMLRQCYLVAKLQQGFSSRLTELKQVQAEIQVWHNQECDKIKIQSRSDEMDSPENVRIYHHELHSKHIKRTSILKLKTDSGVLEGHAACSKYLEDTVGDLLLHPANLDEVAQTTLLSEVKKVFTYKDNEMFLKIPTKKDVNDSRCIVLPLRVSMLYWLYKDTHLINRYDSTPVHTVYQPPKQVSYEPCSVQ